MAWPRQLDRFPLLTVERTWKSTDDPACGVMIEGVVTRCAEILEAEQSVWLASDLRNSTGIAGRVISFDVQTGRVVLELWHAEDLVVGDRLPLLSHEFNPYQIAMVLDETRPWTKTLFALRDAITSPGPDGFICVKPIGGGSSSRSYPSTDGKLAGADGEIVKGAWDHEHCEICYATISLSDELEGYLDDQCHWVCCSCFERYVANHDLSFIIWNSGNARPRG